MLATETPDWEAALQIQDIEHECDGIAHTIIQRLNRTFVTPIDREDIHQLARSLDDVMDAIDAAATVIRRYRVAPVRYGARELAAIIIRSTHQVRMAVDALERKAGVHERAVEVNRLENEADRMHDEALRRLFDEERDPIAVIKWKEISTSSKRRPTVRGRGQRPRGRRRQARLAARRWTLLPSSSSSWSR